MKIQPTLILILLYTLLQVIYLWKTFLDSAWPFKKYKVKEQTILEKIHSVNEEQRVNNVDIFGHVNNLNTSAILVIQVHNRSHYLKHLIHSLSTAEGINKTLLIFSHDLWDDELNRLVNEIDFARSLQIFFPYSIQAQKNVFPGHSSNDCPSRITKEEAEKRGCANAKWPDQYGHYRDAKLSQMKHHFWWKANYVFNELNISKNYQGLVLFLEEDYYLSKDFLSVLLLMEKERDLHFPTYEILSLGNHKLMDYEKTHNSIHLTHWSNTKHQGIAFNREVWVKIHACSLAFCLFDDYNWDYSFLHVSTSCLKEKLKVMFIKGSRWCHIGECGVHFKKSKCDAEEAVKRAKNNLERLNPYLFPTKLNIGSFQPNHDARILPGFGGWGDKRDHLLCMNISTCSSL